MLQRVSSSSTSSWWGRGRPGRRPRSRRRSSASASRSWSGTSSLGGACVNTGTIPSKTIREAILYLTGLNQRAIYGQSYRAQGEHLDRGHRAAHAARRRARAAGDPRPAAAKPRRRSSTAARASSTRTRSRSTGATAASARVTAEAIVIATGSEPARPAGRSSSTARRSSTRTTSCCGSGTMPATIVIVGAGVIGIEYASMFAALGSKVTVVDAARATARLLRPRDRRGAALPPARAERHLPVRRARREGRGARRRDADRRSRAASVIPADVVFYSAGRAGRDRRRSTSRTPGSRPTAAAGSRSTSATAPPSPHIYAVGDVIGFPSLASTSAEQGRLAACDAFGDADPAGRSAAADRDLLDPGDQLRRQDRGGADRGDRSRTRSASRTTASSRAARSSARRHGLVKLLVSPDDRTLLGVHAFGAGATEVVHIGQAVMGLGGTIDYLVDTVFNYPTLAEAYKVAALDARTSCAPSRSSSTSKRTSRVVLFEPGRRRTNAWLALGRDRRCGPHHHRFRSGVGAPRSAVPRAAGAVWPRVRPRGGGCAVEAAGRSGAEGACRAARRVRLEPARRRRTAGSARAAARRQAKFVDDPDGAVQERGRPRSRESCASVAIRSTTSTRVRPTSRSTIPTSSRTTALPTGSLSPASAARQGPMSSAARFEHYRALFDALVEQSEPVEA